MSPQTYPFYYIIRGITGFIPEEKKICVYAIFPNPILFLQPGFGPKCKHNHVVMSTVLQLSFDLP